ncbi:hypothetical protein EYC59_05775 [Candidatus Saccharibacteria bacterium]|nr:MAG: hypothetical protein EYC59_05775 [Candidatus Saccharibacteria bacterium]
MPPGVRNTLEHIPTFPASPALETPPPLTPTIIHEQFRALLGGRDCLVSTPFQKELQARWASQTVTTEFAIDAFEERLVLESSYYLLSARRREQERRIAWQALERAHPYGNPTLPAHGILCGHETFWLYARRPTSPVRVPLLCSVTPLETTPDNHFTAAPASLFVRGGDTLQQTVPGHETDRTVYEQVSGLLGQLVTRNKPQAHATIPTAQRPATLFIARTPLPLPVAA